jgi:hypothetical protein
MQQASFGFIAATLLFMAGSANAAPDSCAENDYMCQARDIVAETLAKPEYRNGIDTLAAGLACDKDALIEEGKAAIAEQKIRASAAAGQEVQSRLAQIPFSEMNKILPQIALLSQTMRESEIAGIVTGMNVVFDSFPRTKDEFCNIIASAPLN